MIRENSISIAMAVYNGENYLARQIESILSQTLIPNEIIICDDASTDSTFDIALNYAKKDKRVKVYRNRDRLGLVKNFEKALSLCNGKYIAFSDQDDIWICDKLETQFRIMKETEERYPHKAILIHSDMKMIDSNDALIAQSFMKYRNYTLSDSKNLPHIIGPNGVMGNSIMINSEAKKIILPFPSNISVHDYWIALIIELYGIRRYIDKPLLKYRIHRTNSSNRREMFGYKRYIYVVKEAIKGNIKLPYINTGREEVIENLLEKEISNSDDKAILEEFLKYLYLDGNKLSIYKNMIDRGMIKDGILFRLGFLIGILLYKRD